MHTATTTPTTTWEKLQKLADQYIYTCIFNRVYVDGQKTEHFGKPKDDTFWRQFKTVAELDRGYKKVVDAANMSIHTITDEIKSLALDLKEPENLEDKINNNQQKYYLTSNLTSIAKAKIIKDTKTEWKQSLIRITGFSVYVSIPNSNTANSLNEAVKDNRCIFIPSRYRAASIKFKISESCKSYVPETALRIYGENCSSVQIVVVDCDEFEKYTQEIGKDYIIVSKPPNHMGVGASRYWCQMIAETLDLKYCWMVDDSSHGFHNTLARTPASTMDVFLAVENVVKYCAGKKIDIGICGIEKFLGKFQGQIDISQKYVGNMVFLNIKKLKKKKVYYRCELVDRKEDILFCYDCFNSGLNVCKLRSFYVKDGYLIGSTGNNVKSTPNFTNNLDKNELFPKYFTAGILKLIAEFLDTLEESSEINSNQI